MGSSTRDCFSRGDLERLVTAAAAARALGVTRKQLLDDPTIRPLCDDDCESRLYLKDELDDHRARLEGRVVCRHDLLYAANEYALIRGIVDHIVRALLVGAGAVVIAPRPQLNAIDLKLRLSSFNPDRLKGHQQLVFVDADEALRASTKGGTVHCRALSARVERAIEGARSEREGARTRCVSTLAAHADNLDIERSTHRLCERLPVSMLCGYTLDFFAGRRDRTTETCEALHGEVTYIHSTTHVGFTEQPSVEGVRDAGPSPTLNARIASLATSAGLSAREHEVLGRLVLGQTLDAISRQLSISVRTVKFHQANLLQKLGVESRLELSRLVL